MPMEDDKREKERKKSRIWQKLLIWSVNVLIGLVLTFIILIGILYVSEYKPNPVEQLGVDEVPEDQIPLHEPITLMTYNIGYGALGDNADFFMDGGKSVKTATQDRVYENMDEIVSATEEMNPDIIFYQEVDENSHRSSHMNEVNYLEWAFPDYETAFAYNFRVWFIPYPLPPIGKVNSGIMTLSRYEIEEAERVSLPCPFTGIERLGNLKRCLLVAHLPVEGSDRELTLINLHLEAYDDGEGKAAQTEKLREVLQAEYEKGNYVIAGGDFNQVFSGVDPDIYPVREGYWQPGVIQEGDFSDDWQFVMDPSMPTCRSLDRPYAGADPDTFQYYMIDGYILSSNVKLIGVETQNLGFVSSDHNPVLMQVVLEE